MRITQLSLILLACCLVTGLGACRKKPSGTAAVAVTAGGGGTATAGGTATSTTPTLPSYWFESDFDAWVGKRWDEIDLFQFMATKPRDLDSGRRYVVFYGRTCDHCEVMFREDLALDPALATQVTAVEVPAEKDVLTSPDAWRLPATECELLSLPLGVNWIITTPLAVRIEDGIIRCAEEGEHKNCLELP